MDNKFIEQLQELIKQGRELLGKSDFSPGYYKWRRKVNLFLDSECDSQTAAEYKHPESLADYRGTVEGQRMKLCDLLKQYQAV